MHSNAAFMHTSASDPAPVLLPGLDLLNHSPTAKVAWHWTEDTFSITSDVALEGGREIFNNYAPKSNEELILGYGFSLFKNPSDHCNLALGPMAVARINEMNNHRQPDRVLQDSLQRIVPSSSKASKDDRLPSSVTGVGWVRLVHNFFDYADNDAVTGPRIPVHVFSPRFLEHASMAFSNAREHSCGYSSAEIELFAATTTRNKLHTASAIAMILQKQYIDILAKNADLPAWPDNPRQFYAARYRRGQILILQAVVESIVANLRGLVGLGSLRQRDKRILRLEHILKAGPKDFLSDFRALLHVGLGTRNADKIKRQESVDTVFTLWLCGLWLWTLPAVDTERQLSVRPSLPERMASWILFIRYTYGQDSDIGRHWTTTPAGEESETLVEACLRMINTAVAKNQRSFYNHSKATSDLLLWCLRVILEETFMCPGLEGQVGDENDETMLFLG
ncbi:MAG: hypothetical protein Q9218_006624 [Villophora microphyllina]